MKRNRVMLFFALSLKIIIFCIQIESGLLKCAYVEMFFFNTKIQKSLRIFDIFKGKIIFL